MVKWFLFIMVLFSAGANAQTSSRAKEFYARAQADTAAHRDSSAAYNFYNAAQEELKAASPDRKFIINALTVAGLLAHLRAHLYSAAHEFYNLALGQARISKDFAMVYDLLTALGTLYQYADEDTTALNFPVSKERETIQAHFAVTNNPVFNAKKDKLLLIFGAGLNDGVYSGSEGKIWSTNYDTITNRDHILLGTIRTQLVFPGKTAGVITLVNPSDSFYMPRVGDLVEIPLRINKKNVHDILDDLALYNIRLLNNEKKFIVHPRTLLKNQSAELYKDIYGYMLKLTTEVWESYKDRTDPPFSTIIKTGRFKGKTLVEAMRDSKEHDLKAFVGYMVTYPRGYMHSDARFTERYAGWLVSDAPPGAFEAMDSLLKYKGNEKAFNDYVTRYATDIKESFHERWIGKIQDYAVDDHQAANTWSDILIKASAVLKNDSLLAWSYWMAGYSYNGDKQVTKAIEYYNKAIDLFKKTGNLQGLSFSINNIGSALSEQFKYKEAQNYFEQAVEIRKKYVLKDTSETAKAELGSAILATGSMLKKQGKNKEAIIKYKESLILLEPLQSIRSKTRLSDAYNGLAKSYEELGEYEPAARYYDLEFTTRKFLGEEEAMGDALDNKAYLLSLLGKNREALNTYRQAYTLHTQSGDKNDAGYSMSSIGQMLWKLGEFDSAIVAHNEAITLRKAAENKRGEAYSWSKLGQLYNESGSISKSMDAFSKALKLYEEENTETDKATVLKLIASVYDNLELYDSSIAQYKQALDIYRKSKSKIDIAEVLQSIGSSYYSDLKFLRAENYNDSAIALQQEINDQARLIYSYNLKSKLQQYFHGNLKSALQLTTQSLSLAHKTTSESNIAFSYHSLGRLYDNLGKYDSALFYFNKAGELYRKLEDRSNVADVWLSKGYHYSGLAISDSARYYFIKVTETGKDINDYYLLASGLSGIAELETALGNFDKAMVSNKEEMKTWIFRNSPWGIAGAYISLGNIHNHLSDFSEAIASYKAADSIYEKLSLSKQRATPMNNIGTIYFYQKDYKKALPEFHKALAILEKTNDDPRFISLVKSNIGEVYTEMKNYQDGEKWLNQAIAIAKGIKNEERQFEPMMILGRLKTAKGEYNEAAKLFAEALELMKKSEQKPSLIQLETDYGKLFYKMKDLANAEKHLTKSIELSTSIGLRTHLWKAYATLGDIRKEQKKPEEAIKQLELAIKVVEELKQRVTGGEEAKKTFANDESIVDLYQKMAKYLKDLGRNDEALAYLEKSNIENILLRFKNDNAGSSDGLISQKKAELNNLEKQKVEELSKPTALQSAEKIARLDQMQTIAEKDYQDYITKLATKDSLGSALQQIDARHFREEREYIPADVALISYLVTDKELSIFIAMKDSLLIKDIPINKKLLEKKITQFYNANAKPGGKIVRGIGQEKTPDEKQLSVADLNTELFELLLQPAMAAIADKKRIAIVPSNLLSFLPFHALGTKSTDGSFNYFGDQKQVFYVNKITTVTNGRNKPFTELRIVAAGNADKTLESADLEVQKLKEQFPTAKVYTGNDATKKNVLQTPGDFNILHLATHGIMDYSNAQNSYLVFAVDKTAGDDDGKLKIQDINKLTDLKRFRMVTLSACETAVIQNITEGWPVSTATAFIEAGVPTVIATLWKVDDKATCALMERFYANMKNGMDKLAALQEAQHYLRTQKEFADPNYWAPFQLVGLWQ